MLCFQFNRMTMPQPVDWCGWLTLWPTDVAPVEHPHACLSAQTVSRWYLILNDLESALLTSLVSIPCLIAGWQSHGSWFQHVPQPSRRCLRLWQCQRDGFKRVNASDQFQLPMDQVYSESDIWILFCEGFALVMGQIKPTNSLPLLSCWP